MHKKRLQNRRRRREGPGSASFPGVGGGLGVGDPFEDDPPIPLSSLAPPHSAPPNANPTRSYWQSLVWWKPSANAADIFEARPAPPSYDDAMMQQQQQQGASQQQQQQQQQPQRQGRTRGVANADSG